MTTALATTREQTGTHLPYLPGSTPGSTRLTSSTPVGGGLFYIHAGRACGNWELATNLLTTLCIPSGSWVATTYLADIPEYGIGKSQAEAIADLLTSLSDYRESLEDREERLGPSAVDDLAKLRTLLRPRLQR